MYASELHPRDEQDNNSFSHYYKSHALQMGISTGLNTKLN